jgi:hypothetical protein
MNTLLCEDYSRAESNRQMVKEALLVENYNPASDWLDCTGWGRIETCQNTTLSLDLSNSEVNPRA